MKTNTKEGKNRMTQSVTQIIDGMSGLNVSPLIKRLAAEEVHESARIIDHEGMADRITLEKNPTCEYCSGESEQVIRSEDGEGIRVVCDEDQCAELAHADMDEDIKEWE